MTYFQVVSPGDKLAAVNSLLVSGGEAPVSSLVTTRPDVAAAVLLLDECSREVQAEGWKFNTEHGFEVYPTASLPYTEPSTGATFSLNVFAPPPNLLSFGVTQNAPQHGMDFVARAPSQWLGGPVVFYDRTTNRDGFLLDVLYIDPIWLLEYDELPQLAKSCINSRAIRRYLAQVVGDNRSSSLRERDEAVAYRNLKREFGIKDSFNIFNNPTTSRFFGGRPFDRSRVHDERATPAGALGGPGYRTVASVSLSPASFTLTDGVKAAPVAKSLSLRRSTLSLTAGEPAPNFVQMEPSVFTLDATVITNAAETITLALTDLNLVAPAGAETVATSVQMEPAVFSLDATAVVPESASMTLLSQSLSLTSQATGFTAALTQATTSAVNSSYQGSGTVTITRHGGFAGAVTLTCPDSRIAFAGGSGVIAAGQTTKAFTYTVPAGAQEGVFGGQITATASGAPTKVVNYSFTVGNPTIDISAGQFTTLTDGSSTSVILQVIRSNFNGDVTITASRPLNPPIEQRYPGNPPCVDVAGNGVTSNPGSSVVHTGTSTASFGVTVPGGGVTPPGSYSVTLYASAQGAPTVTKSFTFQVASSQPPPDTSTTVNNVQMTPDVFTLDPSVSQNPPASIALEASAISLSRS